jgi:hypothetical protein
MALCLLVYDTAEPGSALLKLEAASFFETIVPLNHNTKP